MDCILLANCSIVNFESKRIQEKYFGFLFHFISLTPLLLSRSLWLPAKVVSTSTSTSAALSSCDLAVFSFKEWSAVSALRVSGLTGACTAL